MARSIQCLREALQRIDLTRRGSDEEYVEMTLEELFACGREIARRGNITPKRSKAILREVREMVRTESRTEQI